MTDYSNWVLKEKSSELLLGPLKTPDGWLYAERFDDGTYYATTYASAGHMESCFEPPGPEWVYVRPGAVSSSLVECGPILATHRYREGDPTTMEAVGNE